MGSMLKALGLTIWGLIAIGLLAIFIFVGFEAALKYRAANSDQAKEGVSGPPASAGLVPSSPAPSAPAEPLPSTSPVLAQRARDAGAIKYERDLIDGNSAAPADLLTATQSLVQKPVNTVGGTPESCGRDRNKPRLAADPAQQSRIEQLLNGTDAAKADSGGPLVRLGELYYGYGEYELAIAAIQLGLQKGRIAHLDDAYVYLGRSEAAVGDIEGARNAFNRLKEVPGINPRILQLWTLYAETLEVGGCPKPRPE